jgi:hypothetical protein
VDVPVVGDVVPVVAQWARVVGEEPDDVDAELLHVVELLDQPVEVADAVAVGVAEGLDVQLVEDGVLVPERVLAHRLLGRIPVRNEAQRAWRWEGSRNQIIKLVDLIKEIVLP